VVLRFRPNTGKSFSVDFYLWHSSQFDPVSICLQIHWVLEWLYHKLQHINCAAIKFIYALHKPNAPLWQQSLLSIVFNLYPTYSIANSLHDIKVERQQLARQFSRSVWRLGATATWRGTTAVQAASLVAVLTHVQEVCQHLFLVHLKSHKMPSNNLYNHNIITGNHVWIFYCTMHMQHICILQYMLWPGVSPKQSKASFILKWQKGSSWYGRKATLVLPYTVL